MRLVSYLLVLFIVASACETTNVQKPPQGGRTDTTVEGEAQPSPQTNTTSDQVVNELKTQLEGLKEEVGKLPKDGTEVTSGGEVETEVRLLEARIAELETKIPEKDPRTAPDHEREHKGRESNREGTNSETDDIKGGTSRPIEAPRPPKRDDDIGRRIRELEERIAELEQLRGTEKRGESEREPGESYEPRVTRVPSGTLEGLDIQVQLTKGGIAKEDSKEEVPKEGLKEETKKVSGDEPLVVALGRRMGLSYQEPFSVRCPEGKVIKTVYARRRSESVIGNLAFACGELGTMGGGVDQAVALDGSQVRPSEWSLVCEAGKQFAFVGFTVKREGTGPWADFCGFLPVAAEFQGSNEVPGSELVCQAMNYCKPAYPEETRRCNAASFLVGFSGEPDDEEDYLLRGSCQKAP